jgi:type III pantothenate kinase
MLLVIDTGNTNVVFALFRDREVFGPWRIRSDSRRSRDEYASWLMPLLAQNDLRMEDVTDVVISSVVPDANHHLRGLCRQYMQVEPQFVTYDTAKTLGLQVKVDAPHEVGADRLVNSIAIREEYKSPCIVVDFGTATTFDIIDREGAFIGGVISPGINLSLNALHQAAAMLPRISVRKPDNVIGKKTVQAMQSGVFWGYAGLIEGMVKRIADEMGEEDVFVIATGGLAPVFEESVEVIKMVDRNLTIKGLYHIYQLGKK